MLKKQRDFLRIRHAKEYIDGVRKNPFFFRTAPKRWMAFSGIAFTLFFLTIGAIKLTYLPAFQLKEIVVKGTTVINQEDVQRAINDTIAKNWIPFISKTNVYFIDTDAIIQELKTSLAIATASIAQSGTSFEVTIEEKVMTVALKTKEKAIFLGLNGAYLRDASAEESRAIDVRIGTATPEEGEVIVQLQQGMPVVVDSQNEPASYIPLESITQILEINSYLNSRGIIVKKYSLDGVNALFTRIDTNQSYDLYFDLNNSASNQIHALDAIVSEPGFTSPSEYIDLRFGAYVYLK